MTLKETYILFFAILTVIVSYKLYTKAAGNMQLSKVGPISLTFYFLLGLSYIGTTLIVLNKADHSMLRYLRHDNIKTDVFFITSVLMIVFPLIILILNKLLKYNSNNYQIYREGEIVLKYKENAEFITMAIATTVCVVAVLFVYIKIGIKDNPFLNILETRDSKELALLRNTINYKFTGLSAYIKNIFALALTPFISYIAYIYMRKTKEKRWILLFILLFISSSFIEFYNLQKAPIIIYWASFFILTILYGDKIKMKYFIGFGIFSFIMLNLMYIFVAGKRLDQIITFNNPVFNRLFITTPTGFFLHMEIFSFRTLPLNGASMPRIVGQYIFGFDKVIRSASQIMKYVTYEGVRAGTVGVYNGLFLGEAFANFKTVGIWVSMIHVPIVFFVVNYIFTKIPKTPINLAMFSYLTINLLMTLHGGYADYVFNTVWFLVIIVGILMNISNKVFDKLLNAEKSNES